MRDHTVASSSRPAPPFGGNLFALIAVAALLLTAAGVRWAFGDEPLPPQKIPQPAPPARLPEGIPVGRSNPELGKLQRSYRRLVQLGWHEEAAELAARLGEPPAPPEFVQTVPTRDASVVPAVRTVSCKPIAEVAVQFPARNHARWEDCRRQPVTFRFEGASAAEVAKFVHEATGVAIQALAGATPPAGFHGEVRGKPLAEALELLGVEARPQRGGVAFVPPPPLALRTAGMPLRR